MAVVDRVRESSFARPLRAIVNAVVGARPRVVRVRGGVAKGARMSLDLRREKAYWLGIYEPSIQDFLARHLEAGDVLYDVGAHVGFFSVCGARLGARGYAFEPSPENADRLRVNARLAGGAFEVVETAVWDGDEGVALAPAGGSSQWRAEAGGSVSSIRIDDFVAEHAPPTLIKIDVEGAEARVLRGARATLERLRPVVLCEAHGDAELAEVRSLLEAYRIEPLGHAWRLAAYPPD
jgi:FkbM family methyltransferase